MTNNPVGRVLVTGASGVLGKAVVLELAQRGVTVRGLGRSPAPVGLPDEWYQCDLMELSSIERALREVTTVIHCASTPLASKNDMQALSNLISVGQTRQIHMVYVGITGIERASRALEYYRTKLDSEAALQSSTLSHAIVRISQFHPFLDMIVKRLSLGPFVFRPSFKLQPIDVPYAARELVGHAIERTQGRTNDLHGPQTLDEREIIKEWLQAHRRKNLIIPIPSLGPLRALGLIDSVKGDTGGPDLERVAFE